MRLWRAMPDGRPMTDPLISILENQLDDYLDDLRILVSIDSGSNYKTGVDRVNEWLEARLISLGFTVKRDLQTKSGDNLLAALEGRGSGRILLLGHSDTVFPVGTAAERPMTIAGDKIHGPGTCDMKAGLLTGCYAAAALSELGFQDFGRIDFLCVSDEEVQERYSHELIRRTARQADAVFTLEAARENPEAYRDLIVRVAGYSDYFCDLSEALQLEIISRTEHQGL